MDPADLMVVGAGHAGAQATVALRQRKLTGSIAIVGEEPEIPHERPPLSKDYLAAEKMFERILNRPVPVWRDQSIALVTGARVVSVDPEGPSDLIG